MAIFRQSENIVVVLYNMRLLFDVHADMEDIVAHIAPQITKPFGERIMSVSCNFRPNTIDVSYENLPEKLLEACRQMVLLKEVAAPVKPVKDGGSKKGFALL